MLLKYIYFCLYIDLKYLVIYDHTYLIQHIDAFHARCLNDLSFKCLYIDYKIFILFADNVSNKIQVFYIKWKNQCFVNFQQSRSLYLTITFFLMLTIEHSSTLKKKEEKNELKEKEFFYSWNLSQKAMNEKITIDERIKFVDEAKFTNFSSENKIHERYQRIEWRFYNQHINI